MDEVYRQNAQPLTGDCAYETFIQLANIPKVKRSFEYLKVTEAPENASVVLAKVLLFGDKKLAVAASNAISALASIDVPDSVYIHLQPKELGVREQTKAMKTIGQPEVGYIMQDYEENKLAGEFLCILYHNPKIFDSWYDLLDKHHDEIMKMQPELAQSVFTNLFMQKETYTPKRMDPKGFETTLGKWLNVVEYLSQYQAE